ncbi:hypothetical protein SAMN05443635_10272 [Roseobacter denitrificans OCh 114]|nr:hypothetical protein SAMN05443635_10272 [Roseobacter denitrificans OCh 114]
MRYLFRGIAQGPFASSEPLRLRYLSLEVMARRRYLSRVLRLLSKSHPLTKRVHCHYAESAAE